MNKKGEVTISSIVISCIMFMMFLTTGLWITTNFFSYDENSVNSSYNASYYSTLDESSLESGSNANEMLQTTTGMSDDIFLTNGSVGDSNSEEIMNRNTLTSLRRLPSIYNFVKNVGRDASDKIGIPPFFMFALTMIVIVIIVFGTMKALRGIN